MFYDLIKRYISYRSFFLFSDAMIHSLFTINTSGDVFLEKHWKSVISRSIIDYFFDAQNKAASPPDIPPVIATPHHYLISIFR
jgi:AP-3 complex subunit mu